MTNNNGWPAKPGVPLNPDRDGWHWLRTPDENDAPYEWRAAGECERGRWPAYWVPVDADDWQPAECTYLGPCLTPAEVEARLADALKWRDAIDEALGRCNDWKKPIQDDEKPEDALGRLIRFEVALNLDPETSEHVADLVAQTKRDALEEAARRLEELHKNHNYDPDSGTLTKKLGRYDKWPESAKTAKLEHDIGYYRALVEGAAAIRALEGEGDE